MKEKDAIKLGILRKEPVPANPPDEKSDEEKSEGEEEKTDESGSEE